VDDFYAARDNTMPSLPWPSIAPPFTLAIVARAAIYVLWLLALPVLFVWDFLVGFVQGVRDV
jgi:short subunit dehydrogenase-like uncharacterized protein